MQNQPRKQKLGKESNPQQQQQRDRPGRVKESNELRKSKHSDKNVVHDVCNNERVQK